MYTDADFDDLDSNEFTDKDCSDEGEQNFAYLFV